MQPSKVHLVFVNLMPEFGNCVRAVRGAKKEVQEKKCLLNEQQMFLMAFFSLVVALGENAACMSRKQDDARCDYAYASGVAT